MTDPDKSSESPSQTKKVLLHCPKCNEEFPSQGRERYVQIVVVVRENQYDVGNILSFMSHSSEVHRIRTVKGILNGMQKQDRDAILQHGGILHDAQIELLK